MTNPIPPLPPGKLEGAKFLWVVGLPSTPDVLAQIAEAKKEGKHVLRVVTPEQKLMLSLGVDEQGVTWDNDEKLKRFLFEHAEMWLGCKMIAEPDDPKMDRFAEIMGELMTLHNFDQSSAKALNEDNVPQRNAFRNSKWVTDGVPLKRLKDSLGKMGAYCIIIAAGPSLNRQWAELARIRKTDPRARFFIVGRTYKEAMKHGVFPDAVIECEQFDWNIALWLFAPIPHPHTILAGTMNVCPEILSTWPGDKCVLLDHTHAQMLKMKPGTDSIDGGNSVAHLAFNLAHHCGCNPIILAGVDLGYPLSEKEDTHATGTFHAWGADIERAEHTPQEVMVVESNDGQPLRSSPHYKRFATFFELQREKFVRENPKLKTLTFSPRGHKMAGFDYVEIDKWAQPNTPPPSGSSPASLVPPSPSGGSPSASSSDVSSTGTPASTTSGT